MAPNTQFDKRWSLFVDCPHVGDTNYAAATGINVSAASYTPASLMTGLLLTPGTGNISVILQGGGQMTVPITVATGDLKEIFRGYLIKTIVTSTTTFNGYIYPLF